MNTHACPLCEAPTQVLHQKTCPQRGLVQYLKCGRCQLVSLDPAHYLDERQSKERYDQHRNDPQDPDYVKFLKRLINPLSAQLSKGAKGLDFGCGPGPTVSVVMQGMGYDMTNYDPIYMPGQKALQTRYDFITATEVVEHLHGPREAFLVLKNLLKPGGYLAIMTQILKRDADFKDWWYHRDPTHVVFYQTETFCWIAKWLDLTLEQPQANVVILKKTAGNQHVGNSI